MKEMEKQASLLYSLIQEKLVNRDQEMARLFLTLAKEEEVHEKEVDMAMDIFLEAPVVFTKIEYASDMVYEVIKSIKQTQEYVKENVYSLTDKEILEAIIDLETAIESKHQFAFYNVENAELKQFFKNLLTYDTSHVTKLNNFLNARLNKK
jgi:rubrerythrin